MLTNDLAKLNVQNKPKYQLQQTNHWLSLLLIHNRFVRSCQPIADHDRSPNPIFRCECVEEVPVKGTIALSE